MRTLGQALALSEFLLMPEQLKNVSMNCSHATWHGYVLNTSVEANYSLPPDIASIFISAP